MTNLQRRIATAIATGAMLLQTAAPALAFDISVVGNGSDSDNTVDFGTTKKTTLVQENKSEIKNNISVDTNTGGNEAEDNTNGDVSIKTGDAESAVSVKNTSGANSAELEDCACDLGVKVEISGNGSESDNDVDLDVKHKTELFQDNKVEVKNYIDVEENTGDNEANDNVGGEVSVKTGDADSLVLTETNAGFNTLKLHGGDHGGMISALIKENGSDSDNDLDLDIERALVIDQANKTEVKNKVMVELVSGENEAEDNTNAEVSIETGDVDSGVGITNNTAFNVADVEDCGCALSGTAKIAGNGTDSDSEIDVDFADDFEVFQENDDELKNKVDVEGETGDNEADDNTGGVEYNDPSVVTGDSDSVVQVENTSGVNTLGEDSDASGFDMDFDFDFSFSFSDVLAALFGL